MHRLLLLVVSLFFISCGSGTKIDETPTRGNIKISVDESYKLLIQAEVDVFERIYTYAVINASYKTEVDVFNDFLNDSVRTIVVNRKLTDDEDKYLRSKSLIPRTTRIAYDALAFIVNIDNPDSTLRYDQIRDIFLGKISKWNQVNPKSSADSLTVVFDNSKSGNPRYIREKFKVPGKFPTNCFAVNSNEEVVNYVQKSKNAIGIISVNWVSDRDDTTSNSFMKKMRIVGVVGEGDTEGIGPFLKPYQGYIAEGSYPFCREVYIITRETFAGLGTGFASFVAGDQGQRIILKSGLVPATMPIRLIQTR
jgi:phosphate transport system substrate-binding protein